MRCQTLGLAVFLGGLATSQIAIANQNQMTGSDWQTVKQSLLDDDGKGYYLDVVQQPQYDFFSLRYGTAAQQLTGNRMGKQWTVMQMPEDPEDEEQEECWDEVSQQWHKADSRYGDGMRIEGNRMFTHYDGISAPLILNITPLNTKSHAWQQQLASYPQGLKLASLTWPERVYLVEVSQPQDVICRFLDPLSYPLPPSSTVTMANISSSVIVETLFGEFYPDRYHAGPEPRQFSLDDGRTISWYLQATTSGEQLLAVMDDDGDMGSGLPIDPTYYRLQQHALTEVQWYEHTKPQQPSRLRLTFAGKFAAELEQHLRSIGIEMKMF